MKVVIVNQPMDMLVPPHQNSLGIWTYKVAPILARDHQVTVIGKRSDAQRAWDGGDGVVYEFVAPLVPNRVAISVLDRLRRALGRDRLPTYATRFAYLDYATKAAWTARRQGADVVHVHNWTQFVPVIRRFNPDATIVLHMACEWLSQLPYDVMDRRLGAVDAMIGVSDHVTDLVTRRFPHHAHKCSTVVNGVDVERFDGPIAADDERRVLFVGRVSPEKGVHDLIAAFVRIADEVPDARLDLVGPIESLPSAFIIELADDPDLAALARFYDSAYAETLRELVPDRLRDRVTFMGGMSQDDLIAHYRRTGVVANVSYSESFGMSLVEALACRTPVIATRVGGMPGIVGDDASVGLLVDRGDVGALADALTAVLGDDDRRRSMAERARDRVVDRYSWDRVAAVLADVYRRASRG